MPRIFGKDYENSAMGAARFQYDLMNPFDTDPRMFALRMAYGTGIGTGGFAVASLITGTPMPNMFVQSITRAYGSAHRAKNIALLASKAATPLVVLPAAAVTSAVVQREVWQEIGDEKTGAVHFAGAGGFTGGSMPVVTSQDTSSPTGDLDLSWSNLKTMFGW
jgi:hypothetical protein